MNCTLDDDLSEVGVTGALLAVPNDDELLPKLPLPQSKDLFDFRFLMLEWAQDGNLGGGILAESVSPDLSDPLRSSSDSSTLENV